LIATKTRFALSGIAVILARCPTNQIRFPIGFTLSSSNFSRPPSGVPEKKRAGHAAAINCPAFLFWPYYEQHDMADRIDNTVNYSIVAGGKGTKNFCARSIAKSDRDTRRPRLAAHLLKTFRIQKITRGAAENFLLEDCPSNVSITVNANCHPSPESHPPCEPVAGSGDPANVWLQTIAKGRLNQPACKTRAALQRIRLLRLGYFIRTI